MSNETNEVIYTILSINPGSTSTKVAVYKNEKRVIENVIRHKKADIEQFDGILEQKDFRTLAVLETLEHNEIALDEINVVVGRGGLLGPMQSGTYPINNRMLEDLQLPQAAVHASSLGAIIANEIGQKFDIPAFIVDPVVVDELERYARLSGMPDIDRVSKFHALNSKSVARHCAKDMGKEYEDCRFIVAHMGGGISVSAHRYGRVIDVNDGISEGPFSPERCGTVPVWQLISLCYSGKYTLDEMLAFSTKSGGMSAYIGTNDLRECEEMIMDGNEKAELVFETMAYQISKEIGAMFAVLEGRVDAIILTGGLAYSNRFVAAIKQRVSALAPVKTYAGEEEMLALTEGALRVLRREESPKTYK